MTPLAGLVLGRFQPLHLGHVEYLAASKERCDRLFVGITNPDPQARIHTENNPSRGRASSNPFTYLERAMVVEAVLRDDLGWNADDYFITPAPLLQPERLVHFVPVPGDVICYVTVYDAWGRQKSDELRAMGYEVVCLWQRADESRITSGSEVRELIRAGDDSWHRVVPPAAVRVITGIVKRSRDRGEDRFGAVA